VHEANVKKYPAEWKYAFQGTIRSLWGYPLGSVGKPTCVFARDLMFTQLRSRARFAITALIAISSLSSATIPAQANILISNTVLGSSTGSNESGCGWLVMPSSTISPTSTTTVDVIFTLGANANPAYTYGIVGGQSGAENILLNGNSAFKRIDLDFGGGTSVFYLQGNAAFVPGTTYHLAVQNNGTTSRIWVNGAAMTTTSGATGVNLFASQTRGVAQPMKQIGNYYNGANTAFQGIISYVRVNSTFVYAMNDTVTMTNTLDASGSTLFLLTPNSSIPTYSLITAATYSNPNVTFTGKNNFSAGDVITVKNSTAPAGFAKSNATVTSANNTSFTVNYGASNPGTWATGNLGAAVTTSVTKDDIGNTAITWYDGVCSSATGAPGIVVTLVATIGLSGGGNIVIYRVNNTLQVPMSVAGKITFYQQGKVIAGCKNIYFAIGTATCTWRPTQHGVAVLTAVLNPTDKNLVTTVPGYLEVFVVTRQTRR
jgi:hypothetical protein